MLVQVRLACTCSVRQNVFSQDGQILALFFPNKNIKLNKRPSKVNSVGRFLLEIPWSSLLSSDQSCEGKLSLLTEVINYGLDTIMPVRSIKMHETDRPWVSKHFKQLIIRRQKALSSGNQPLFKILRNKVNRERKGLAKFQATQLVERGQPALRIR